MRFLIAIPTYNRADLLGPSLDSIRLLKVPRAITHLELVVIDNNCTDETATVVQERKITFPFSLQYVIEPQQGLCFGRNRALAMAQGFDHLILLDDDIRIHEHWLDGYCHCLQQFQADCVIGPVFAKFLGIIPEFLTERARASLSSPYSWKGEEPHLVPSRRAHEIAGCNFGVSVDSANRIGGFNPELDRIGGGLLAGGDFDFGHRLVQTGARIAYHPACAIDHIITTEKLTWQYLRRRWRGTGATMRKLGKKPYTLRRALKIRLRMIRLVLQWILHTGKSSPKRYDDCLELDKWRGYVSGRT